MELSEKLIKKRKDEYKLTVESGETSAEMLERFHSLGDLPDLEGDEEELDNPDDISNNSDDERIERIIEQGQAKVEEMKMGAQEQTIAAAWKGLSILCTTDEYRFVTKREDILLLPVESQLTHMELVLLAPEFSNAIFADILHRLHSVKCTDQGCPPFHRCLAWLTCAAQTSLESLLPKGECSIEAEEYIKTRLIHYSLPAVKISQEGLDISKEELAISQAELVEIACLQLHRVLNILSIVNLDRMDVEERSFILFVVCRICLDKKLAKRLQNDCGHVLAHFLDLSLPNAFELLFEFSRIFPLLLGENSEDGDEDFSSFIILIECFRNSAVSPTVIMCLIASLIDHAAEHSIVEFHPDSCTEEDIVVTSLDALQYSFDKLYIHLREKENRENLFALVHLIDAALFTSHLHIASDAVNSLKEVVLHRCAEIKKSRAPDDMIVSISLNDVLKKLESLE